MAEFLPLPVSIRCTLGSPRACSCSYWTLFLEVLELERHAVVSVTHARNESVEPEIPSGTKSQGQQVQTALDITVGDTYGVLMGDSATQSVGARRAKSLIHLPPVKSRTS